MTDIVNVAVPRAETSQLDPLVLDKSVGIYPFLAYARTDKKVNGNNKNFYVDNTADVTVNITVPGSLKDNMHLHRLSYKLIAPHAGVADSSNPDGVYSTSRQIYLPTDRVSEIGAFWSKFSTNVDIEKIPDVAAYSKQQSATVLNFRTRGERDRLYFPSHRSQLAKANDASLADPYFETNIDNGKKVPNLMEHSNSVLMSVNGSDATTINAAATPEAAFKEPAVSFGGTPIATGRISRSFDYLVSDALPNTFYSINMVQKRTDEVEYEITFKKPNDTFLVKGNVANTGPIVKPTDNVGRYFIQDLKIVYYNATSYEEDNDKILSHIANDSYTFFYPHPIFNTSTINGSGQQDMPVQLSKTNGITVYKIFASLQKTGGFPSSAFSVANFKDTETKAQFWGWRDHNGNKLWDFNLNDKSYHELVKMGCQKWNSLSSDASIENYGTHILMFDTEIPEDPYNPMSVRGRNLDEKHYTWTLQPIILGSAEAGADAVNTNSAYRYNNCSIVMRKGVCIQGSISLA